jgi:hypothetical protein
MTFTPLDEINLALVMSQELLMAWAATLAITTFIPLVQIAAVKMYASSDAQPLHPTQDATPCNGASAQSQMQRLNRCRLRRMQRMMQRQPSMHVRRRCRWQ